MVAAAYLLRDDGAALLQLRDDFPHIPHAGTWVPPGGHCRPGEDIDSCIRREFLEETGYRLGEIELLTQFIDDHAEGFDPLDLTVYWAAYDGLQPLTCHEGQKLEFVERADVDRLGVPRYLVELWDEAVVGAVARGELAPEAGEWVGLE
jgi:8-oxo-dGTP pyrophosphatase MutT (NUDIX family)